MRSEGRSTKFHPRLKSQSGANQEDGCLSDTRGICDVLMIYCTRFPSWKAHLAAIAADLRKAEGAAPLWAARLAHHQLGVGRLTCLAPTDSTGQLSLAATTPEAGFPSLWALQPFRRLGSNPSSCLQTSGPTTGLALGHTCWLST